MIRPLARLLVLLAPAAVILVAAAATPMTEFFGNQGDVSLYLDRARAFANGQVPYRDFLFEYPPLALVPMTVPYVIWPGAAIELDQYRRLFAGWEAGLMVVLGFVLTRIRRLGGRVDRGHWPSPPSTDTMGAGRSGRCALSQDHAPDLFECPQHPSHAGLRVRGR